MAKLGKTFATGRLLAIAGVADGQAVAGVGEGGMVVWVVGFWAIINIRWRSLEAANEWTRTRTRLPY